MVGDDESGYNGHMRHRVGIREFRDGLSRWIDRVRRGDEVVVTNHGTPVAVISSATEAAGAKTWEEHLARLEAEGAVVRGSGALPPAEPVAGVDRDLAEAVLRDREERDRFLAGLLP